MATQTAIPSLRISRRVLQRYLLQGEVPVVATRQHWAVLVEPFATTLGALLLVGWLVANLDQRTAVLGGALWVAWLVVVGRAIWKLLAWHNDWFVATDRRLLLVYGLISQRVAMMPLNKVTDMNYQRSITGRLLGYGRFVLESAGQDQAMREINFLPDPDEKYRRICAILFREQPRPGGHGAQAAARRAFAEHAVTDPFETADVDDEGPAFSDRFDPDVTRVRPLGEQRRRWEPVERHELPTDWDWVDDEARRARAATRGRTERGVAVDPDPTPYR